MFCILARVTASLAIVVALLLDVTSPVRLPIDDTVPADPDILPATLPVTVPSKLAIKVPLTPKAAKEPGSLCSAVVTPRLNLGVVTPVLAS